MYETHFGFYRQPFQSADGSRAFFVSESIRSILPQLLHALRSDLGVAVLTGVPGSGKTSLLRHLQQQLSSEGRAIVCSGANLGTSADLTDVLLQASRLKAGTEGTAISIAPDTVTQRTRSAAMEHMRRTAELWGPVLLLIDDAQLVPLPVLNELRACTEEEWNSRGLVRCLVSAPVSFEEQLARSEYAEFGRRVRCHAFLQPLKSVESIRFLQEHIELAGGRLPQILTTSALELIVAAADGIPRCLSLLADECLLVAAECGEKPATEESVRTALSHLQHLQYNWNASPHADVSELPLADESPVHDEATAQVESIPVKQVVSRQTPARATLSPGVIEFGGPSTAAAVVSPAAQLSAQSMTASTSGTGASINKSLEREGQFVGTVASEIHRTGVVEFGVPEASGETMEREPERAVAVSSRAFEVGHRFTGESLQDSISIDESDDSSILDLLNSDAGFDTDSADSWDINSFPDAVESENPVEAASTPAATTDPGTNWFNGNTDETEPDPAAGVALIHAATEDIQSMSDQTKFAEESRPPNSKSWDWSSNEQIVATANRTTNSRFIDLGDSRLSNRTPVFDRYTWLSLGREVPPGISSIVSPTNTERRMLSEYGVPIAIQPPSLLLPTTSLAQFASINQIPITRTTDSCLIKDMSDRSRFEVTLLAAGNLLADDHQYFDAIESETPSSCGGESEMLVTDPSPLALPVLKIWHDGQLIFGQPDDCASSDVLETEVERSVSLAEHVSQSALTPGLLELNAQHFESEESTAQESAAAKQTLDFGSESQLNAGGFFTLPAPDEIPAWDLNSPEIVEDPDVFPIVEEITSLRADVRSFQQTGKVPGGAASGTGPRIQLGGKQLPETDSLISRAKRQLDDRATAGDSTVAALQMTTDPRVQRTAHLTSVTDPPLAATDVPDLTPQFSSLFTRLLGNRRRAAGQAETDR